MKALNKVSQILSIAFGAVALFLFFTPFATVTANAGNYTFVGAQLAFGANVEALGEHLAKSANLWFCFFLTAFAVLFGALTFKFKGMRYAAPVVAIIDAVYMLVIALSDPWSYVDTRPIANVATIEYSLSVLLVAVAMFACFVFGLAHLLIDDYIFVRENKGKLSIPQRIVHFVRDYKSEVKKIVWPGFKEVVKNTLIVLVISAIIGIFIWLLDFGLGQLVSLIIGKA